MKDKEKSSIRDIRKIRLQKSLLFFVLI